MERDIEILRQIFEDLHYTKDYANMLINHLLKELDISQLSEITPRFVYINLIFEEGRETARKISEYFEEMKEKGAYTPVVLKKSWN
jgi:hypothetical protein